VKDRWDNHGWADRRGPLAGQSGQGRVGQVPGGCWSL